MTAQELRKEVLDELQSNILPFWMEKMEDPSGGFRGRIDGKGHIDANAPKGAILNARILWTFSSAYRIFRKEEYLLTARRAFGEIRDNFIDRQFGGVFWSLDPKGRPLETKKQIYAIGFAIYGLSEFYRATGEEEARTLAAGLYKDIEEHSFDPVRNGYLEAFTREWAPIQDMRLSEKDRNDAKTMNTHLHILEGYTALYRVWKDSGLGAQLHNLIEVFLDRIEGPDGHLQLFFDEDWRLNSRTQSYGHDIEASWLLSEAAGILGDEELYTRTLAACSAIAEAACEGLRDKSGMIYEWNPVEKAPDTDRHWWVQAETVVGCYNQYQQTGDHKWLDAATQTWGFIKGNLIRPEGEWWWSVREAEPQMFTPNTEDDIAGFWKCPYHNGRMCMELIERV